MSTFEGLGQLQLGTRSPKVALEKLFMAATNVVPTDSAATEDSIYPLLRTRIGTR